MEKFVNGDVVEFNLDSHKRVWTIRELDTGPDKNQILISTNFEDTGKPHSELAYPHLIRLVEPIMQFFRFAHLPQALQDRSFPFWKLATEIVSTIPRNPERTVALRKLLEAKDAAVRAAIYL